MKRLTTTVVLVAALALLAARRRRRQGHVHAPEPRRRHGTRPR